MESLRVTLQGYDGAVWIVPADAVTRQYLADSIGGYADIALKTATGRDDVNGRIDYHNLQPPPGSLELSCAYREGEVVLSRR